MAHGRNGFKCRAGLGFMSLFFMNKSSTLHFGFDSPLEWRNKKFLQCRGVAFIALFRGRVPKEMHLVALGSSLLLWLLIWTKAIDPNTIESMAEIIWVVR